MSLAAIILFVNYAGQYVYGQYALTISIVYAVNNSLGGWIGQIILKFYTPKKSNNRLKKFLLFSIVISLLIGILIQVLLMKAVSRLFQLDSVEIMMVPIEVWVVLLKSEAVLVLVLK